MPNIQTSFDPSFRRAVILRKVVGTIVSAEKNKNLKDCRILVIQSDPKE